MDCAVKINTILATLPLLLVALPAYSWGWDRDYESCVLNHIEDAKSDTAARLIKETCRKKYPMTYEECKEEEKAKGIYDSLACIKPLKK